MAAAGWTANVKRFPDPNNLDHLALPDFSPMRLVTDSDRRRADAILHCCTDRLPFVAPSNWESLEPVLRNAVNWAFNAERHAELMKAPQRPVENAIEKIVSRGERSHD